MHYFAILITLVSFYGIPLFLLLAVIQFFRGKTAKTLFKIGVGLIPVLIIGIALGEFTTPNYWDKSQKTEAQKKEERKIQENIDKNWAKVEEQQKKREQAEHESVVKSIRGPEEIRAAAKSINYKNIQNNPDQYIGKYVKFEGTVNEIREVKGGGVGRIIALNVRDGDLVRVKSMIPVEFKRGDHITAYGTLTDLISYTNNSGEKSTAPSMSADLIE